MINKELLNSNNDEYSSIGEGTDIPVTITYVTICSQNYNGGTVDCLKVTLESKDKKKLNHRIPMVEKFSFLLRDLFIAVGLSEMKDGKEVIISNEENDLVGKQLLIDTGFKFKGDKSYLNVIATKKINAGNKDETGVQQSINAQSPSSKGVSINVPPEFDEKVKENLDF